MASRSEIQRTVEESDWREWQLHHERVPTGSDRGEIEYNLTKTFTYSGDVNIRLEKQGVEKESFTEPWTEKYSDTDSTQSYHYGLYYGSSIVDTFVIVGVDGFRAFIPLPDRKFIGEDLGAGNLDPDAFEYSLDRYHYRVGKIITQDAEVYSDKLNTGGIDIK